ncbi:discoidin domain-containing protein [Rubellicoccus peritrichatus]|uniref:Discoidin domain-containing protein n=1 Tax=Rubellicoccus peritrichatus TaxID=3080537 RepID=A0AAQ3LA41_9BACT|nr:discoidin domain-containing protein [Puniceicoccus sp. CR14]WOO40734.1 discoidin domain-containing protein [Puniceicoccus sp. CR14]
MKHFRKKILPAIACFSIAYSQTNAEEPLHHILLNPLEPGANIHKGSWYLTEPYIKPATDIEPQMGEVALTFGGNAGGRGGKGDFDVSKIVRGEARQIGLHVHLTDDANVNTLGLQLYDDEGEIFIAHVPADWTGWRHLEFDLIENPPEQIRPQPDKNGTIDYPIRGVHFSWFAKAAGPTHMTVDGLTAKTIIDNLPNDLLDVDIATKNETEAGEEYTASIFFTNYGDEDITLDLNYSLQRNDHFFNGELPHPIHGSNHASGIKGWVEYDDKKVEDNRSTDGKSWTNTTIPYQKNHYIEAIQTVDLGQVREVQHIEWTSGDANNAWFVDVLASTDGSNFEKISDLQNVDQHKKWGRNAFPKFKPFKARYIKFHNRTNGDSRHVIRFPSEIMIYDGTKDEPVEIPSIGEVVYEGELSITVPARSFAPAFLEFPTPLSDGAYMLGMDIQSDGFRQLEKRNIFTALPKVPGLISPERRIGINTSKPYLAETIAELGASWVRFENGKWPMMSSEPHKYQYNPGAKPWQLNFDETFGTYKKLGINVLTYMFLVPEWASQPGPDVPERVKLSQPPKNLADYGEFTFQTAARYASKKHPDDVLKTDDKVSGLDYVKSYNMYNEPNLNAYYGAKRGGWAAPMDLFYKMMRYGVEGVRRADPDAIVTGPSLAGATVDTVDMMRTYTYEDGKHPVDLVDVICVHFYSGHDAPETARNDGNTRVVTKQDFPEHMRELSAWRDRYAHGKPIWMTETGYDSAGEFGTNETIQAARLPRQVMLSLAYGAERVFIYREAGSTPRRHSASGVLRNDLTKKPSWYTFGTLIRQFQNVTGGAIRLPHPDSNVWLMLWNDGGQSLVTAWTVEGDTTLDIDLGSCDVTNAFGTETKVDSTKGLKISTYPSYLRGFNDFTEIKALKAQYNANELARQQRIEQVAAANKYLFDFGSTEQIGDFLLDGFKTPYQTVQMETVWTDELGYGFDKAAKRMGDRKYLGNQKADRDSVKVRGQVFSFKADPGSYKLEIKAEPYGKAADVKVRYNGGDPITLKIEKDNPIAIAEIVVTEDNTKVDIEIEELPADLFWINCVEVI